MVLCPYLQINILNVRNNGNVTITIIKNIWNILLDQSFEDFDVIIHKFFSLR